MSQRFVDGVATLAYWLPVGPLVVFLSVTPSLVPRSLFCASRRSIYLLWLCCVFLRSVSPALRARTQSPLWMHVSYMQSPADIAQCLGRLTMPVAALLRQAI